MTTSQKTLLALAATAVALYSGGTYIFSLHGPLDALGQPAGTASKTLEFGGRTRNYLVHPPKGYDGKSSLPLVLVLHGAIQGATNVERMSGMSAKADKENFLAVYPNGTSGSGLAPTWNAGACCGYAQMNKVDDVGFLRALIDRLEHDYPIDPKRVFATGISNGGMMSYRLACEMADRIAAVAPQTKWSGCGQTQYSRTRPRAECISRRGAAGSSSTENGSSNTASTSSGEGA